MFRANVPGVTPVLRQASAFIGGAGGLGSNVAVMLVRAGIGKLCIVDFDCVSISNLNRQNYGVAQIGRIKVEALRENLLQINPALIVEIHCERLTDKNFSILVPDDVDLIFECFDDPGAKAALCRFALTQRSAIPFIAVSGIGGAGPLENIRTVRKSPTFYLIGDGESDVSDGNGTLSTRVIAAAAAQAHCGIQILLNNAKNV